MRVGTMTSLFSERIEAPNHISYLESIRRCKEAGFEVLDINMWALPHKKTELHKDDWKYKVEEIRNLAEKLGITFSSSHPPFRPEKFKSDEDEEFYELMAQRAMEISGMLGVKWAVLHPATEKIEAEYSMEANIAYTQKVFEKQIEIALHNNVGIVYENLSDYPTIIRRFGSIAQELDALIKSYNDSRFGICWDTGHGNLQYKDQTKAIRYLGKKIKVVHINDNFGYNHDDHLLPMLGNIVWKDLIRALDDIEYEGDLMYEINDNHKVPDEFKDRTARYAYDIGKYLISLAK